MLDASPSRRRGPAGGAGAGGWGARGTTPAREGRCWNMDEPKRCASCDIELADLPFLTEGSVYCCHGCAQGGPCVCSYADDPARYPRNGHSDKTALDLYGDIT